LPAVDPLRVRVSLRSTIGIPRAASDRYLALGWVVPHNAAMDASVVVERQLLRTDPPLTSATAPVSRRAAQPGHREVAVAALLDGDERVLLVRTRKLPLHWQPPGGGVDPEDSSPVAALVREMDEELGLDLDPSSFQFEMRIKYDFGSGSVYCFSATVSPSDRMVVNSAEIAEARWFSLAEARTLPAYPATRALLDRLLASRQARSVEIGHQLVAASAIPCPVMGEVPRELSRDEIATVCAQFGAAAALAEAAGAHLVEIHAAHGYLVGGFLSPYSNVRDDEYRAVAGGQSRFLAELLDTVRSRTSLPLGLRVSVVENVDGGLDVDGLLGTLSHVRQALSFVSVSGGVYVPEGDLIIPSRLLHRMLWREQAAVLRRHLALPVLLSGNFQTLDEVEAAIADRTADMVLMVRSLLADPDWLLKWRTGQGTSVQPCINCNLCKYHTRREPHVYCPFNPELISIRRRWLGNGSRSRNRR